MLRVETLYLSGAEGDALTQQPSITDWSAAVAEEEQRQAGYYTDSMLNNRPSRRRGWARGRGRSGSYRDLGRSA